VRVSGAAALGALVPAIVALLYAKRGQILARGASRKADAALDLSDEAGQSAQSAHARLDAYEQPFSAPQTPSPGSDPRAPGEGHQS
jgi:hypothetical protein